MFLFLPSSIGKSHLYRLIILARRYEREGEACVFAFPKQRCAEVEAYGFKCYPLQDIEISDFTANIFEYYTVEVLKNIIEEEIKLIQTLQPHLILSDFRPSAAISTKVTNTAHIVITNAYLTAYFEPISVFPSPKNALSRWFADLYTKRLVQKQKADLAQSLCTVAKEYKCKTLRQFDDFFTGDRNFIPDLEELYPLKNLPADFQYIYPLVWNETKISNPTWLENKPLVYVTIGNTGNAALIDVVLITFKDWDKYQVLISTGHYHQANYPQNLPSHIRICQLTNGEEAMQKAVLAIHCGGNGTMYQALRYATPSIVIPYNNEQRINAFTIYKNKLGVSLEPQKLNAIVLRNTVPYLAQYVSIDNLDKFSNILH